jgi:hypothetical protein
MNVDHGRTDRLNRADHGLGIGVEQFVVIDSRLSRTRSFHV